MLKTSTILSVKESLKTSRGNIMLQENGDICLDISRLEYATSFIASDIEMCFLKKYFIVNIVSVLSY